MDIVITYVNGQDPLWLEDYCNAVNRPVLAKRFRDWGMLRYLLRGIEKNIPFVRNVFLVVARESQVPDWVDRERVKVVLHRDIIPQQFLPVFNSSSIEMFLHRIKGLDEHFVYLNDDFFPVRPCTEETFFENGKAVIGMKHRLIVAGNPFRFLVRHSDCLARKAAGLSPSPLYLQPQHICYSMLKSRCDELFGKMESKICSSVTALRDKVNYNIYLYLDYIHYCGDSVDRRIPKKHFSLAVSGLDEICTAIRNPNVDFLCINDVQMTEGKFCRYRDGIISAFEDLFPQKSAYEL